MGPPSRDDYRPGWYRALERGFDLLVGGSVWLIWIWGLAVFALVGWGLFKLLFRTAP